MRILVVAPSWVGDAVMTQPLLTRLRRRHPGAAIDVLAPPWTAPVFRRMPEVSAVIESPFRHGAVALGARRRLGRSLAPRAYNQAIVLPNSFKSALIPWFAGIPLRTGYRGELRWGLLNDARRPDDRAMPRLVERFAALADAPGAPPPRAADTPPPRLSTNAASAAAVMQRLGLGSRRPAAVLCPGAEYGPAKRWPPAHFAALARRLAASGYQVWLLGSPKDAEAGEQIMQLAAADLPLHNLCGGTTLEEAVDVLSGAALVVSNDSGLMHVAAALDRPLVALYGSSSPAYTPPLSPAARIIRNPVPCSPCFERVCPLGHFDCMMQLTPEQVWAGLPRTAGGIAP